MWSKRSLTGRPPEPHRGSPSLCLPREESASIPLRCGWNPTCWSRMQRWILTRLILHVLTERLVRRLSTSSKFNVQETLSYLLSILICSILSNTILVLSHRYARKKAKTKTTSLFASTDRKREIGSCTSDSASHSGTNWENAFKQPSNCSSSD